MTATTCWTAAAALTCSTAGRATMRYSAERAMIGCWLFYTHVTDRFTPFRTKVIAANAGEAAHVLVGLLDHESELVIREHATDTAGAVDHVFGLCHLLGFRFAPRIRDLNERRLYGPADIDFEN